MSKFQYSSRFLVWKSYIVLTCRTACTFKAHLTVHSEPTSNSTQSFAVIKFISESLKGSWKSILHFFQWMLKWMQISLINLADRAEWHLPRTRNGSWHSRFILICYYFDPREWADMLRGEGDKKNRIVTQPIIKAAATASRVTMGGNSTIRI